MPADPLVDRTRQHGSKHVLATRNDQPPTRVLSGKNSYIDGMDDVLCAALPFREGTNASVVVCYWASYLSDDRCKGRGRNPGLRQCGDRDIAFESERRESVQ